MCENSDIVKTVQNYFRDAMRTANTNMPPLDPKDSLLIYLSVGLADESSELLTAYWNSKQPACEDPHFIEEMGDVCWHLIPLYGLLTGDVSTITEGLTKNSFIGNALEISLDKSLELLGIMKKVIYHKHPIDAPRVELLLKDIFGDLAGVASQIRGGLEAVLRTNVEKLKKRYPQGFTYEDSRNRQDEEKNAQKER